MWILSEVMIVIGALMLVGGVYCRYYRKSREELKGRATGRVIELLMDKPDREGELAGIHHYYYPMIAYYAKGLLYKSRYEKGSNPSEFALNQELKIHFDLEKPYHFAIAEHNRLKLLSKMLYIFGLLLCISGGIVFVIFTARG